jgi:hypothetical protein
VEWHFLLLDDPPFVAVATIILDLAREQLEERVSEKLDQLLANNADGDVLVAEMD